MTILYVDASSIRSGRLEELQHAMADLAAFVEANEPQLVSYRFFVDDARQRMTVVAVHPDVASMEFHMDIAGEHFKRFSDLIDLETIDVYGEITDSVLERLRAKAAMLGRGTVRVHNASVGFVRS